MYIYIYITHLCTIYLFVVLIPVTIIYILCTCIFTIYHNYDSHTYTCIHIGLSYATGGILLGGKDWAWSTASMVTAAIVCIGKG